jgi:hypothetical protein
MHQKKNKGSPLMLEADLHFNKRSFHEAGNKRDHILTAKRLKN